eukprot:scaffold4663_cov104-Isochrysis_galbana.AAC.8
MERARRSRCGRRVRGGERARRPSGLWGAGGPRREGAADAERLFWACAHFDVGFDVLGLSRRQIVGGGSLAQLQIAHRRKLQAQVDHWFLQVERGRAAGLTHAERRPLATPGASQGRVRLAEGRRAEAHVQHATGKRQGQRRTAHALVRRASLAQPRQLGDPLEPRGEVELPLKGARGGGDDVIVVVELQRGRLSLAPLELPHDDQVVSLTVHLRHRLCSGAVTLLLRGPLAQHGGESLVAVHQAELLHILARARQQVQVRREPLLRVRVYRLARLTRLAHLEHPGQYQHHVRSDHVGRRQRQVRARPQGELRQRGRHHRGQEIVATHQQAPQLWCAVTLVCRLVDSHDRSIRPISQHNRPPLDPPPPTIGRGRRGRGLAAGRRPEGQLSQRSLEGGEAGRHLLARGAKFADEPQRDSRHARRVDGGKGLQQLLHDRAAQVWERLQDLAHKQDDLHRRALVRVAQKVHQHRNHR